MNKFEFLEILKQSLAGEVKPEIIEQNIRYYDQYISGSGDEQLRILDELGDPRLIAKTIIETEKAARDKGKYSGYQGNHENNQSYNNDYDESHTKGQRRNTIFFSNFTWYHKLILLLILIFLVLFVVFIGRIIIGLLFTFGIPIMLLLLVMYLFRKRQ